MMTVQQAFALALQHHQAGRLAEAEGLYRQILAVQPGHLDVVNNLGLALAGQGRFDEATGAFRHALQLRPDFVTAHFNLGNALKDQNCWDEAAEAYRRVLEMAPDSFELLNNLGAAFAEIEQFRDAVVAYQRALAIAPESAAIHTNLGCAYTGLREWDEAIGCFRKAIALQPENADAYANLAKPYHDIGNFEEALDCALQALRINPRHTLAHLNVATAWLQRGEIAAAENAFRQAIQQEPSHALAHSGLGMLLLLQGQFSAGWREMEWRWQNRNAPEFRRRFSTPRWDGSLGSKGTILIHSEQGLGDTIQFSRYLPLLCERAAPRRVIFEVAPELVRLFTETWSATVEIVSSKRGEDQLRPLCDRHLPLLSAPHFLGMDEPLGMEAPYLRTNSALRTRWRELLDRMGGQHVGLVAGGNPTHLDDRQRSVTPDFLQPFLRISGIHFYNLQVNAEPSKLEPLLREGLIDETPRLIDFAETAAFMAELDLIISVDTAAAHLAGALGRPVWTLLPFVPDWRWGLEGETTPWYPTMRLFRQPKLGDWESVVERVAGELERFKQSKG